VARQPLAESVREAVAAGVDWVQVRERGLDGRELLLLAQELSEAAHDGARQRGGEVKLLVNRRVDVAWSLAADGVHLGFDAMPTTAARELLGEKALLGMATHGAAEAAAATHLGIDYVQLAPIHPPVSKAVQRPPLGAQALRRAAEAAPPILAQGGIVADNAGEAIAAGAAGIAVTGAILGAADPGEATRALRAALDG
jgi:thiamine-phosphate pyrophosphorylase